MKQTRGKVLGGDKMDRKRKRQQRRKNSVSRFKKKS